MADYDINEQKYVKVRKGRSGKLHKCTGCFCEIPVGTEVHKNDYNGDGKFWHDYWCDFCYDFLDYLDSSDGYSEGCTLEYLYEVYESEENLRGDFDGVIMLPGQEEMLLDTWRKRKKSHEEYVKTFLKAEE